MIRFAIAFILIGLLVFTTMATFDYGMYSEYWGRAYALWDKASFCLLAYLAIYPAWRRKEFKPVFYLLLVRLSWDCISWATGLSVNNPKAVGILFMIYISYVCIKAISKNVRN